MALCTRAWGCTAERTRWQALSEKACGKVTGLPDLAAIVAGLPMRLFTQRAAMRLLVHSRPSQQSGCAILFVEHVTFACISVTSATHRPEGALATA
jgi:hypothetical protein